MRLEPAHVTDLVQGKQALLQAFGGLPNATAFAYGFRRRDGRVTDEPAVIVSVAKKRPAGYVSRDDLLPRTVDVGGRTYGVDVIQAGPYFLGTSASETTVIEGDVGPNGVTELLRPAQQGCMITNSKNFFSATFGCLVRDRNTASGHGVGILTSAHALGSLEDPTNQARAGDDIVQPAPGVGGSIGQLAQMSNISPEVVNHFDAAVVSVVEGINASGPLVDTLVANQLMPTIQQDHPAVGHLIANATDGSSLMSRIRPTLAAVNADFWGNNDALICDEIDFDMNVDKVGAQTGYTSSVIVGIGATPVNLSLKANSPVFYMFDDLVQVDTGFSLPVDNGAVVCRGGNGNTRVLSPAQACSALASGQRVTGLPLTRDNALADDFRDKFLMMSRVGRMLVRVFYVNYQYVVSRMAPATLTAGEKDSLASLYSKYRALAVSALGTPDSAGAVVTQGNLNDANNVLQYLMFGSPKPWITSAELSAAWSLNKIFQRTLGMNRQQLINMLNSDSVYGEVYNILAAVPTIQHLGAFGADK